MLSLIIVLVYLDVDECLDGTHNCVLGVSECVNTKGSWKCECDPGYIQGDTQYQCLGMCILQISMKIIINNYSKLWNVIDKCI